MTVGQAPARTAPTGRSRNLRRPLVYVLLSLGLLIMSAPFL